MPISAKWKPKKFDPHWFYCLQWECNNLFLPRVYFITVKGHRENSIPRLMINNTLIKRVTGFNVLGLIMNNYMKLNSYTKIASKISHTLGVMIRLKRNLPLQPWNWCMSTIYWTFQTSNFELQKWISNWNANEDYKNGPFGLWQTINIMPVKYILSSVWGRWSIFSQLSNILGCVFSVYPFLFLDSIRKLSMLKFP